MHASVHMCPWFFFSIVLFHDSGYQLRVADFHLEKNGSALVAACDYRFVPLPSYHVTCSLESMTPTLPATLPCQPEELSLISGTHVKVEGIKE